MFAAHALNCCLNWNIPQQFEYRKQMCLFYTLDYVSALITFVFYCFPVRLLP